MDEKFQLLLLTMNGVNNKKTSLYAVRVVNSVKLNMKKLIVVTLNWENQWLMTFRFTKRSMKEPFQHWTMVPTNVLFVVTNGIPRSLYQKGEKMRELLEAKYCKVFNIQKSLDEDMECEECNAYMRALEEPNPYKCKSLIFLRWWADEVIDLGPANLSTEVETDDHPIHGSARSTRVET